MKIEPCEYGKSGKVQQLVASTVAPILDIKGKKLRKKRNTKFTLENVSPKVENQHNPHSRQTIISDYFTTSPKETLPSTPKCDEAAPKQMINVPRLLSQLLKARVVLSRISMKSQPSTIADHHNSRAVQRYCCKCKTFEIDDAKVATQKICQKCNSQMIYVCVKCNTKHFAQYRHMRKHFVMCNGKKNSTDDELSTVIILYCSDCPFKTTYRKVMRGHIKSTGHKELNGAKIFKVENV